MRDDLGVEYLAGPPRRVVSLVPSATETIALAAPWLLVGATDYCDHPIDLAVPRVGGSKYPKLNAVLSCRPDLVVANAEENRKSDVEELRAAGIAVWVSFPKTVPQACDSAAAMLAALGVGEPEWIGRARRLWTRAEPLTRSAVIPIWRKPWMVLGPGTFAGDVLARLGVSNVFDDSATPYPKTTVEDMLARRPDLAVLPDEPYAFTADDGPEALAPLPCCLVSGRHLTWHGPSLVEAHEVLGRQLREATAAR
ncbi:helical backbone metal receptor [Stackebrandtia nassauensis]|uniref:Periplasmic binding protein n=1 Tax=Stackebrandtia nassauensis (strain DSM 44728 / CIP 108903 / NRRL B-16338 / NBRC 102104 / LLR-40K-21) TaxID=446470 RepID=D3Q8M2_STANL|nr:helical backbone metal receptor [Stackebrandtia nassauensis]ADD44464.1 periplasmic binding protein [Stackebrandtia nassauensis DSM 44728]